MIAVFIVLATIITSVLASVFMKILTTQTPILFSVPGILAILQNPFTWLAITCYALTLTLFTMALSRLDLSITYTSVASGTLILVTILSALIFHEPVTIFKLAGIALILSGVFLIYRS